MEAVRVFHRIEEGKDFITNNLQIFITFIILGTFLIGLVYLLHFYTNWSIFSTVGLDGAVSYIFLSLTDIDKKYTNYCANRVLLAETLNLTVFPDMSTALLDTRLRKINVFKKSKCNLNNYFWNVKTKLGKFFYTDQSDARETLKNILRVTMISVDRDRLVNIFFEYCLISFLTQENVKSMSLLSKGDEVMICDDVHMVTDDFFKLKKKNGDATTLTPDVRLRTEENFIIIDAYNGSNLKEVKGKLRLYKDGFKDAEEVYVVASALSTMEQIVSSQRKDFVLYQLGKDGSLNKPSQLKFGEFTFDIKDFNDTYREELEIFASEVYYWQLCEVHDTIIQNSKYR
jgi:hypothetical protein